MMNESRVSQELPGLGATWQAMAAETHSFFGQGPWRSGAKRASLVCEGCEWKCGQRQEGEHQSGWLRREEGGGWGLRREPPATPLGRLICPSVSIGDLTHRWKRGRWTPFGSASWPAASGADRGEDDRGARHEADKEIATGLSDRLQENQRHLDKFVCQAAT